MENPCKRMLKVSLGVEYWSSKSQFPESTIDFHDIHYPIIRTDLPRLVQYEIRSHRSSNEATYAPSVFQDAEEQPLTP